MGAYVNIDSERGGWSGVAEERCLVLAHAMPDGHDEAFKESTRLASEFCSRVCGLVSRNCIIDTTLMASAVRQTIGLHPLWYDWYIVFSVAICDGDLWEIFSCGTNVVVECQEDNWVVLVEPQSLASKIGRLGLSGVSMNHESVATIAGSKNCCCGDVLTATVKRQSSIAIAIFADGRVQRAAERELEGQSVNEIELLDAVKRLSERITNANTSFVYAK